MNNIIETHDLCCQFNRIKSVDKINIQIPEGAIYGFLGPNGAGKTTTLKMLLGLLNPSSGSIKIFGEKMPTNRISILREIGSLIESPSFYGHLSGYKNLKIFASIYGLPNSAIEDVLNIVELTPHANRPVKHYSFGMKQRLGIAIALIHKPKLLILDEPTNGLDPAGIQQIRDLIKRLPTLYNTTVLISSHLLSEVEQIATHVGIIHGGKMLFQDAFDVLRKQQTSYLIIDLEDPSKAYQSMQKTGWDITVNHTAISIRLDTPGQKTKIFECLKNFNIINVKEKHRSLEDIFLDWTGVKKEV
ncbi:ABC transporter ATP-binding protein [Polycladospora coralii]